MDSNITAAVIGALGVITGALIQKLVGVNNKKIRWIRVRDNNIPPNAIEGGNEINDQGKYRKLYICRSDHENGTHVGKVWPGGACHFGFGSKEILSDSFEILVEDK